MEFLAYYLVFLSIFVSKDALCNKHGRVTQKDGGKIVGGYDTTIQNVPYQVYLLLQRGNDYYSCGGSLISNTYVLTAAHCLTGISKIFVRVGSTDSDSGGTVVTSRVFTYHPLYNQQTYDYDVGVVRLSRSIKLDNVNTKTIQLARARTIRPGTVVTVTGWGATSENGDSSHMLLGVQVPTISNQDCKKSYASLTSRMVCAGFPEGGKDSCQGDSGGPAVSNNTQLGIVSFGMGCAREGYPGVYTNVAVVRNWIKIVTGV